MTKREKQIVHRYFNSKLHDLHDCYKTPSDAKRRAFEYICEEMQRSNGEYMRILSYNGFMFTCAYRILEDDHEYLVYHTPYKAQLICMDELYDDNLWVDVVVEGKF